MTWVAWVPGPLCAGHGTGREPNQGSNSSNLGVRIICGRRETCCRLQNPPLRRDAHAVTLPPRRAHSPAALGTSALRLGDALSSIHNKYRGAPLDAVPNTRDVRLPVGRRPRGELLNRNDRGTCP